MRRFFSLLIIPAPLGFAFFVLLCGIARADDAPTKPVLTRETLPSGVRLIVETRPKSPLTAIEIMVRSGSGVETLGNSGVAHCLEHLIFRGSTARRPGEMDEAMETLGGEILAWTTRDATQFSVVLPSANWRSALSLLMEALKTPVFSPEQLAREKAVIRAEKAVAKTDPARAGFDRLAAVAFPPGDPYRMSLMGEGAAFEALNPDDLRRYYRERYTPANMTVTLVGDLSAEDARRAVAALFPAFSGGASPAPNAPLVVPMERIVRAEPIPPAQQPTRELTTLILAFAAPPSATPDALPALDALMPFLAEEREGRLPVRVVRQDRLALSITAEWVPQRRGGLILITTVARPRDLPALEDAIIEEIRRIREDALSEDAIAAAKRSAAARARFLAQTVEGRARQLTLRDLWNPALSDEDYLKRIESATTDDLRPFLLRYLTPLRYTAAVIGPPPPPAEKAVTAEPNMGGAQ